MSKYTTEQVEVLSERDWLAKDVRKALRDYAALLREHESARAAVTDNVAVRVAHALEQQGWATGGDFHEEFLPDVRAALEAVMGKVCR